MADLLTLEHAWSRLTTHLEWADRFWVLFVFTDDPRVVEILRRRTQAQLAAANRSFVALRPAEPADIDDVILGLLEGATTTVSLVDLVRHDDLSGAPGWAGAWQRLLLRLNERRELSDADPAARPKLAASLTSLGEHLRGSGQLDEALAATQEAVELWQQLSDERGLSMLHGLEHNGSAEQLGRILIDLGRAEQAVEVLQRVTANYEERVEGIKGELEQNDDEQA